MRIIISCLGGLLPSYPSGCCFVRDTIAIPCYRKEVQSWLNVLMTNRNLISSTNLVFFSRKAVVSIYQ